MRILDKKWYICCFLVGCGISGLSFLRPPTEVTHETVKYVDRVVTKEVVVEKKTELSSKENKANKITIHSVIRKDGSQSKTVTIVGFSSSSTNLGVDQTITHIDQTHTTELTKETTHTINNSYNKFDLGLFWSPQDIPHATAMVNYNFSPIIGVGILTKFSIPVTLSLPQVSVGVTFHF